MSARAVVLPRLILVADGFVSGRTGQAAEAVRARVQDAVAAGVAWVHLRDHAAGGGEFADQARRFVEALRAVQPSLMLSVNRRLDVAAAVGAGLHTGRGGPSADEARARLGPFAPVGYSAQSADEACEAAASAPDYVFLGAIYPTATHPERAPLGPDVFRTPCLAERQVPTYAIGGVTPERAAETHAAGAYGAAVLSGFLDALDLGATVRDFLHALTSPVG